MSDQSLAGNSFRTIYSSTPCQVVECGPPEGAPTAFQRSAVVPRRLLP